MPTPANKQAPIWSAGAWIGSVLGCTLWMLIAAAIAIPFDPTCGIWILSVASVVIAGAIVLWRFRTSINFFVACQIQIVLTGLGAATILWLLKRAQLLEVEGMKPTWQYLSIFPILMIMFELMRRKAASNQAE